MRYIYTILFYLALPFILLRLLWRSRKLPAYRQQIGERFGWGAIKLPSCIWVHAVSVGETIAAIPLIKQLIITYPHTRILVTNMTPTGASRVNAAFGNAVSQAYIPYDIPSALNRFIKRVNPLMLIIMETELWPNLFFCCKQREIPIVVVNARLSEKSARGYGLIPSLTKQLWDATTHVAVQSQADADRFHALGLAHDKMTVTGNLKFDLDIPADINALSSALKQQLGHRKFIWIAASTHPGEEEMILAAAKKINEKYPSALLILVPRHPDRFDDVARLLTEQHFISVRRSSSDIVSDQTHVYLGDTMGELLLLYSVADIAFVGGSFVSVGGHNLLEPAAFEKPILSGPALFNFVEISQLLLDANGMRMVQNVDELADAVMHWFSDMADREHVARNAYQVISDNKGALARQVNVVNQFYPKH